MPIAVAHIVSYPLNEDLKEAIKNLAFYLSRHGVISYIFILGDKKDIVIDGGSDFLKAKYFQKKTSTDWALVQELRKELKVRSIRVVHSHDTESLFYATWAGLLSGRKRVHTIHTKSPQKPSAWMLSLNHHVVVSFNSLQTWLQGDSSTKNPSYSLIRDGFVSCPESVALSQEEQARLRKHLGLKTDSLLVGNISAFIPENDHMTTLKALRKLAQKKANVELILLGQGPLKDFIEKTALEYGLQDMVKICPDVSLKEKIYGLLDAYVLSSFKHDDIAQIAQAMCHALPVVASKIFLRPEIIQEGTNGFLVPCGYPERIETAIMKLLVNPGLKEKMQEATKESAKLFTIEQSALSYLDLYKRLTKAC
jgi:glycosyltransferase involved in cell wall biosynthesis